MHPTDFAPYREDRTYERKMAWIGSLILAVGIFLRKAGVQCGIHPLSNHYRRPKARYQSADGTN